MARERSLSRRFLLFIFHAQKARWMVGAAFSSNAWKRIWWHTRTKIWSITYRASPRLCSTHSRAHYHLKNIYIQPAGKSITQRRAAEISHGKSGISLMRTAQGAFVAFTNTFWVALLNHNQDRVPLFGSQSFPLPLDHYGTAYSLLHK